MKTTITRSLGFDAGHRLVDHESKCANVHGHRYTAEIEVTADELDFVGRVVDFSVVKREVGTWIDDNWDHAFIADPKDAALIEFLRGSSKLYILDSPPTAENLARYLYDKAARLLRIHQVRVVSVVIWETPNCSARYVGGN